MKYFNAGPGIVSIDLSHQKADALFPDFSDPKFNNCVILPGFVDVHVHLREPGFSYKETVLSGTLAAAHGGFTAVCPMPNLDPVPDCLDNLIKQLDIINRDALIRVIPFASITVGEKGEALSEMERMAPFVAGFSDDGRGVQSEELMLKAMTEAKRLDKIIAAHCEDNSLLFGGYIHAGEYAKAHGHRGICSESEWKQIERDIELVRKTGCKYHICHISTAESVELVRRAKREGLDVTCETAPHYLVFTEDDLIEDGSFKMNPPLRTQRDRDALIEGIVDGTIDIIATDHAPHSKEEKSKGLEKSAFGIVGLETAFPVLYTHLVRGGVIGLERLTELMSVNPAKRFGIDNSDDFTVFDLEAMYRIDNNDFLSKGKSSPFVGMQVFGKCMLAVSGGSVVYRAPESKGDERFNA
ncbi:MAG: dihydroorotase [Clostridia bacterium]|nr:dihydroorotase [Clostridia bacterium]